ncbi:MAG: nitroreductase [Anaerolineales bacterium]|nr:nitroreductase [Anaerolineales bacterium]
MDFSRTVTDGAILSLIASIYLFSILKINARLLLQDYPEEIRRSVPPKTDEEKQLSVAFGIPFLAILIAVPFLSTLKIKYQIGDELSFAMASLHAFGILLTFNLIDWLVLDWLVFCTITPRFVVIPAKEGMAAYKNYVYHFKGFLIGTALSIVVGLIIGAVILVI